MAIIKAEIFRDFHKYPSFLVRAEIVFTSRAVELEKGDDVKDDNVKIFIAELIGTMVLVLGGCGTAVLATSSANNGALSVGTLGVSLAFGLSVLVMAYAIGPISGCHINPAVTLGLVIAKKTRAAAIPIYWIAQLTGAIIGALIIKLIASGVKTFDISKVSFATNGYGAHSPGKYSLSAVGISEIVFTMVFVLVVIHTTRKDFSAGFAGLTAGLTITLIHLVSIPVSNTSVNPARSFGVAIFKGDYALDQYWAFAVFPLIGAIIAAIIGAYVFSETKKVTVLSSEEK